MDKHREHPEKMQCSRNAWRSCADSRALVYGFGIPTQSKAQSYVGIDLYLIQSPSGDPVYFPNGSAEVAAGGQVVGYPVNLSAPGGGGTPGDGMLWTPPAGKVVDLTLMDGVPANATDGVQQVGGSGHALLWSGTAASVIDLHPTGFVSSQGYGVASSQQVGAGQIQQGTSLITHALLWNGTANSAVDMQPTNLAGFDSSIAYATDGTSSSWNRRWQRHGRTQSRAALERFGVLRRRFASDEPGRVLRHLRVRCRW